MLDELVSLLLACLYLGHLLVPLRDVLEFGVPVAVLLHQELGLAAVSGQDHC